MLHSLISIRNSKNEEIKALKQGEETSCDINPSDDYHLVLIDEITGKEQTTVPTKLYDKKKLKCFIEGCSKSSIYIKSEEKKFENNKNLAKYSKTSPSKEIKSWIITIYAEYVIVNKTQYNLILSDLEILKIEK